MIFTPLDGAGSHALGRRVVSIRYSGGLRYVQSQTKSSSEGRTGSWEGHSGVRFQRKSDRNFAVFLPVRHGVCVWVGVSDPPVEENEEEFFRLEILFAHIEYGPELGGSSK